MKISYKGCEIEVTREKCLGGWDELFYSVFDGDFEVVSGYSEGDDKIKDFANDLKEIVDDYRENPEDYIDDFDEDDEDDEDDEEMSDSEWARSIDYGGYDTEDEFWEHIYKF